MSLQNQLCACFVTGNKLRCLMAWSFYLVQELGNGTDAQVIKAGFPFYLNMPHKAVIFVLGWCNATFLLKLFVLYTNAKTYV